MKDCKEAGVNGFIIVDLPPEEAITFRNFCGKQGLVNSSPKRDATANILIDFHTSHLSLHPQPTTA